MQISCPCLNLSVEILLELDQILDDDNLKPPENLENSLNEEAWEDEFFSSFGLHLVSLISKDENASVERIPSLIESRLVSGWDIRKCILCNLDVFAVNSSVPKQLLCSRNILKQQLAIAELQNSGHVSSVFRVILPKIETDAAATAVGVPDDINRIVQNIFNDFVKKEQESMDERIQRFTEEQQNAFVILKQDAKKERAILLASLSQNLNQVSLTDINDENDYVNALPLTSGRPSTSMSVTWQDEQAPNAERDSSKPVPIFFRPKSHSNPVTFLNSKRKRHSGGSAKASGLSSHVEEHFMFNMDDHDTSDAVFADTSLDDEATSDEKDTEKGEDYLSYYPPPPLEEDFEVLGRKVLDDDDDVDDSADPVLNQFGTSLPVTIPSVAALTRIPPFNRGVVPLIEDDETPTQQNPKDVGASMQALARSIQAVDDPERLFGERPRRRWKTGEILQDSAQRFVYAGRRPQAF